MATVALTLPSFGESMQDAVFVEWLKADGDRVEREEPVCVVETDKVDAEVTAPEAGVLRGLQAQPQERVAVGATLALIETA